MKYSFLTIVFATITFSAFAQINLEDYDEADFFYDSLYAVKYKAHLAQKDSIELSGTYERLDQAIEHPETVKELHLKNSSIKYLPDGIEKLTLVESVIFEGCKNIDLDDAFVKLSELPNLKSLEIIRCKQYRIPENISGLENLENLNLLENKFVRLPETLIDLKDLVSINVSNNSLLNETLFFDLINQKSSWKSVAANSCQIRELPAGNYDIETLSLNSNLLETIPVDMNVTHLYLSSNPFLDLESVFSNTNNIKLQTLDIGFSKLTAIPSSIGNIGSLQSLNLEGNYLTAIPSEIGNLTKLTSLKIGNESDYIFTNQLTTLPNSIENLTLLTHLDLSGNKIDKLPSNFGKLQNLIYLDLTWNKLTSFPSAITSLTSLKHLDLSFNQVKTIPDDIGNLVKLEYLDLSGDFFFHYTTKISSVPSSIGRLVNLQTLILKDNVIETLPTEFENLTQLEELNIADNLLGNLPDNISNFENLKTLQVEANELKTLPVDFGGLQSLEHLDLSLNFEMDTDVEAKKLAQLKHLNYLNIADSYFTTTAVDLLQKQLINTEIVTAMDGEK